MTGSAGPASLRVEDYALSLLLHDIGKFWERSSDAPRPSPAELALYCPRLAESGGYGHTHAALSARFIEDVVRIEGASRWGPRHHLPDLESREELCAHLGDWLAGGETGTDESRDAPGASSTPLRSVLSGLSLDGTAAEPRFFGLSRLDSLPESLTARPAAPVSREDYRFHWNHFLNAIDKLGTPISDLETWIDLLQVFVSRIPAAATNRQLRAIPDIDLFTHSRAVAALSVALWRGPLGQPALVALRAGSVEREGKPEAPPFTLIAAEVAGARKLPGASRRPHAGDALRGGMLFVDLLAEEAARRFAGRLGLPLTSVLEVHGPRFTLLAPALARWEEARDEVEGRLAGEARGELGLEAAAVGLSLSDLRADLGRVWLRLEAGLEEALAGRLSRLSRSSYDRVFGFVDPDGSPECGDCGGAVERPPPAPGEVPALVEDPRCELCSSLARLGQGLGEARFLIRRRAGGGERGYGRVLARLDGWTWEPVPPGALHDLAGRDDLQGIYSLGRLDLEGLATVRPSRPAARGFRWIRGGGTSASEGGAKAVVAAGANGLERLLALGVPPGGAALARILAISAGTRLFFTGWAASAIERGHAGSLVLLGSGKDDLLAWGDFPAAVEFLRELAPGFAAFLGHPALSLSSSLEAGGDLRGGLVEAARASLAEARRRLARRGAAVPAPAGGAGTDGGGRAARSPASLTFLGADLALEEIAEIAEVAGWISAMDGPGRSSPEAILRVLRGAGQAYRREEEALRTQEPGLSEGDVREAISWKRWRWSLAAGLHGLGRERLDRLREWLLGEGSRDPAGPGSESALRPRMNIERLPLVLRWVELHRKGERS